MFCKRFQLNVYVLQTFPIKKLPFYAFLSKGSSQLGIEELSEKIKSEELSLCKITFFIFDPRFAMSFKRPIGLGSTSYSAL